MMTPDGNNGYVMGGGKEEPIRDRRSALLSSSKKEALAATECHGTNSKQYKATHKTLGSFGRIFGPAADIQELEYISALHQNAEVLLRSDGTISSQDIVPYLSSRYGLEITEQQAVDIACGLCGAKPRSDFSAEQDAQLNTLFALTGAGSAIHIDKEEEDDKGKQEAFYFDLVQVMSLLLIPELSQLRRDYMNFKVDSSTNNSEWKAVASDGSFRFCSSPTSFRPEEEEEEEEEVGIGNSKKNSNSKKKNSNNSCAIFQVVIDSLIEIFDETTQKELRNGGTLDEGMLQRMLHSFGDIDSANNPKLMKQMLQILGPKGSGLTIETFSKALTSDVGAYQQAMPSLTLKGTKEATAKTSIFYDAIGFNWDDPDDEKNGELRGKGVMKIKTASYIDYAADTYRSTVQNTAVWALFIMSSLVYLTYTLRVVKGRFGDVCAPDGEEGEASSFTKLLQTVEEKENYGCVVANEVAGWLLTASFSGMYGVLIIVPISMGNLPKHLKTMCFSLILTMLLTYLPFGLLMWYRHSSPHNPVTINTYTEVCPGNYTYTLGTPQLCNATYVEGESDPACDPKFFLTLDTECLPAVTWCTEHPEIQGKVYDEMPNQLSFEEFSKCWNFFNDNDLGGEDWFWYTFITNTTEADDGNPCEDNHLCASGFCDPTLSDGPGGICATHPLVCPQKGWDILGGFRLDPYCRTYSEWCTINNPTELVENFEFYQLDCLDGTELYEDCVRALVCIATDPFEIVQLIDTSDPGVGDDIKKHLVFETTIFPNYNSLEEALVDVWTYYVLLCTAGVGILAVMSMLKGICISNIDRQDRPRDYHVKCAATRKVANMIENALSMHPVKSSRSSKGQAVRNFFLHGKSVVETGGLFWTWNEFRSGRLLKEEGVRFSGRIWIGQVVQVIVLGVGIFYGVSWIGFIGDSIEEIRAEVGRLFSVSGVEAISDRDWVTYSQSDLRLTDEQLEQLQIIPQRWMTDAAGWSGVIVGSMVALYCIFVYLPSYTNTVLKLRNGMLASLHDPYFHDYRKSPDNVVQNVGNMVFSMMGAAVLAAGLVSSIVFTFVWPWSQGLAFHYVAIVIGLGCTIVVKVVGQKLLRGRNFSAFYRKKPRGANVANLFFECWYIGTGLLVVVSRLVSFMISGVLWLGRIDCFFLHQNVKVLGTNLDQIPVSFLRDLMVHEAHSHPYIERLGGMYLLRLRDESFGNAAGTAWRCLFVAGLMPWVVKHKVNNDQDIFYDANQKLQDCYLMDETERTMDGTSQRFDDSAFYLHETFETSDASEAASSSPDHTYEERSMEPETIGTAFNRDATLGDAASLNSSAKARTPLKSDGWSARDGWSAIAKDFESMDC